MTLACGDSHTSTHGAFGTLAFGIGTSQVRDVLATQTLAMDKLKVRRIKVNGALGTGVYAKDVILSIIRRLGVGGGKGFAYEYGGSVIDVMNMEERMTVCNMSIEGGALVGYVNPDTTTFEYLEGRRYVPSGAAFERAVNYWKSVASDADAVYDDLVEIAGEDIEPTVTWGINPGQAVGISEKLPKAARLCRPGWRKKSLRAHGLATRNADPGDADRCRVYRLLHQFAADGPTRCGRNCQRPQGAKRYSGVGGSRFSRGKKTCRSRRTPRDLHGRRFRVA